MKDCNYPLVIVGAGPIGIACALEAQRNGVPYVVLEKGTLVNSIYHYPVNMTFFSTSERLEIGGIPFVTNQPKPKRADALEYYRRVAQDRQVNLHLFEEVTDLRRDGDGYEVVTGKGSYGARFVILATGFYDIPFRLDVPGEDLPKVKHYYDDPHFYAFQKVVVVGAQNSAVDAALECWRKGASVTMVVRGAEIGQRVKYWVRPDIINRIAEGSIKAYFNSSITGITPDTVEIQSPDGPVILENDWVLALTGYQPNLPFLRKLGIAVGSEPVCQPHINEETHETNLPGIYLAGVICGGMNTHRLFIENSREHAVRILADIRNKMEKAKSQM
ncbi:YpdA family putative bacillithiol disulfide reductase [Flaviaesturariibacter flavus]|uniref:YpdA family putative bacillithiol disulfide reductase n=1 Tax=Flaviaesturariibacter flavus TaxID=2502780 RepID=A0A4R1BNX5_9BACT|nr:YpdA family putative bacillithiol disulfide reductase [Flaviaesturariibacter flavus]TCJ19201.1 YpdA family putative bacillithiol disulfide reductase [Flaviaesturariibacter flavus]